MQHFIASMIIALLTRRESFSKNSSSKIYCVAFSPLIVATALQVAWYFPQVLQKSKTRNTHEKNNSLLDDYP